MKNTSLFRRFLSVVLVLAMVGSLLVPAASAETTKTEPTTRELELIPTDASALESLKLGEAEANDASVPMEDHALTDVVRVSIVLDKASTLDAGFSTENIANNAAAMAYREGLRADQAAMTAKIEQAIGGKLDVQWNLTLAANIISANVTYGKLDAIKAIDGVKEVFVENRYEPQTEVDADEPNNGSASYMIGSNITWANGYTGAGSKVAIIDTGADTLHQSFSGEGLEYAFAQTAEEKGMTYDEYVASLDLLTAEKIEAVKGELNANIGSGEAAYRTTKIPYGYNYVDKDVTYVDHDQDTQGEHGSHVSGISTANRFIKVGEEYKPALEAVGTQGVAPDAQLVVMKVFGKGGGAYDSDYMVAIEDAIVLGCDSANLSLGSGSAGFSFSAGYEAIMNKLIDNGMVVAMSAGNSYGWYSTPYDEEMYAYIHMDDVKYDTAGSPGSFTNSLTVASVDNMGQTGMPLIFGDRHVFYSESSGYGNDPISTLAGQELEYVYFDNYGADGDGNSLLEPYADAIAGKVVLCSRGTSSFYQKVNAAAAAGAIACIIYNNQAGTINMNLQGVTTNIPAVSILQSDGNAIKAQSTAVTAEDNTVYYTGTMSISEEMVVQVPEVSDNVTVSSFSSYGMPGTLVLKPEILAPGGSIYSVWGANAGQSSPTTSHEDYEMMSGTSMASPQVAGMAAVMGQYIRENGLCEKTGLTARQLINSLLMSTAHPVYDSNGKYWPVFRVGAGLGNVADASAAQSYILMDEGSTMFPDTAKDGKVKAELGDDPDRTGEYSYKFTVNPIEGTKQFTLRTDMFLQDFAGNSPYGYLQYTGTTSISNVIGYFDISDPGYEVSYVVNGETYENAYRVEADVNGDGETNEADAQAILDYVAGELAEDAAFDAEIADVDGDGKFTTYDAHLILQSAATPIITANGPTEVTVNIKLTDTAKEVIDYLYNATYIQGYTFVDPVADEEGSMDVVHSIPILAFYGSWTDASMLDRTSVIDSAYGTGKRPYFKNNNINYMTVKDANGATVYMGNPYAIEDKFPVDRLAMNSETTIQSFTYMPIRNIATQAFAVTDEEGKVIYSQAASGQNFAPYYYVNGSTWQNVGTRNYNVGKTLGSTGVKEGDKVTVGFYALPEYYGVVNAKNNGEVATTGGLDNDGFKSVLESGIVGDGAGIKYTVTVDDTAPTVIGAMQDLITGNIVVKCSDNNYVAYVAVTNKSGSKLFFGTVPEQTAAGEVLEVPLNIEETLPSEVVLVVGDYAGNEAAFKVNLGGSGADDNGGLMIGFVTDKTTAAPGQGNRAWEIDKDTLTYNYSDGTFEGLSVYANMDVAVRAAEYAGGYVFMAGTDGWFYAAELNALDEAARVGSFSKTTETIYDMAFNYLNNTMYVLGTGNMIYSMDLTTGALTPAYHVTLTGVSGSYAVANKLAIDDNGTFYIGNYGTPYSYAGLSKFTAPEPEEPVVEPVEVEAERVGDMGVYNYSNGGAMAWDHTNHVLYLVSNYSATQDYDHYLWVVDTKTGAATRANSVSGSGNTSTNPSARLYGCVNGLFIVPGTVAVVEPTDVATDLIVEPEEINMFKGQTREIKVAVMPWTLTDKDVTFASDNENVATVDDRGTVTSTGIGTATITVTTVAKAENGEPLTATVTVNVTEPPAAELRGIIWDENGKGQASVFNSNDTENWEALAEVGQLRWGALVGDMVYGSTDDTMYGFDADTYELETYGGIVPMWIPSDAVELPQDIRDAFADMGHNVGPVLGPNNNGTYLSMMDPAAGSIIYFNLSNTLFGSDPMATIAYAGRGIYDDGESTDDNAPLFYVMTESGNLYLFIMNHEGSVMWELVGETGLDLTGVSDATNQIWASSVYDAENEFLYVSHYDGVDDFAHLYAIDVNDTSRVGETGTFNTNVWPVTGLYEYTPATDLSLKVNPTDVVMFEGDTAEVKIKVKLGETNEYTAEIADPSIITFEDGVITGLKEGETTITVTTVDTNEAGEHLTETINVKVKGLKSIEAFVTAQVTDERGTRFTKISLADATASRNGVEAPGDVTSGGRGGDVYLAGMGTNFSILDAETFQVTDTWNGVDALYSQYPALDVANFPMFTDDAGVVDNHKFLFTTNVGWLVMPDYSGWNLSSFMSDMAGVCFAGTETMDDGTVLYIYYILGADGTLYNIGIDFVGGRRTDPQAILDTGIVLGDQSDASMAFINTVDLTGEGGVERGDQGIVIADNGTKKLWYLDFTAEDMDDVVCLIGTLEAENVSGLVGTFDSMLSLGEIEEPEPEPEPAIKTAKNYEAVTPAFLKVDLDLGYARMDSAIDSNVEMQKLGEPTNAVVGGTNAAKAGLSVEPLKLPVDETSVSNGNVEIKLSEDVAVTNGLIKVTYDADKLTYVDTVSGVSLKSIHHEIYEPADGEEPALKTGVIVFAYASADEIAAENVLATLKFTYEDADINTTVVVTTVERNDNVAVDEDPLVIEIGEDKIYNLVHELKDGDEVVIVNSGFNKALSTDVASEKYLAGKDVVPTDNKIVNPAADTVWTVHITEEGVKFEDAEGNTLTATLDESNKTGLGLGEDHNLWILEATNADATYYVKSADVTYSDKAQYLEYYSSKDYFSIYGLQTGKENMYTIQFYANREDEHDCKISHFVDLEEYPYGTPEHEAIEWAYTHGYAKGMDETHFSPATIVTRAQAMTFLYAVNGKPTDFEMPTETFSDVSESDWFYKYVMWGLSKGLTKGFPDGTFGPDLEVTRAQMLQFFYAAEGKPEVTAENPYTDVPDDAWYKKAAIWAYENGLEKGEDGVFAESTPCPRVTVVLYLYRYYTGNGRIE